MVFRFGDTLGGGSNFRGIMRLGRGRCLVGVFGGFRILGVFR